jgi:8-oxo-dGTP pyrophosphatase MutT (NUDIX family)
MSEAPSIFRIERQELSFSPKPWAFAIERRAEIDAYFEDLHRKKPAIWNGRVLLMHHQVVAGGVLRGKFLEADYASFAAWRHWGRPAAGVHDCFGTAAVMGSDGAFLLGVMGQHTFNSGKIYFPCGTPDPDDIIDGKVDLDHSTRRELKEETGFDVREFDSEPDWTMVVDGPLIALIKVLRSSEAANVLRERVLTHLALEREPELSDICVVRDIDDFDRAMPRFISAFLASRLSKG